MIAKTRKSPRKKNATPIEIGALLMETVCVSGVSEQPALEELAEYLGTPLGRMQSELLFLRAFAVDFALNMSLGDGPARWAIAEQYYRHWETVAEGVGEDTIDGLEEHLNFYTEVINTSHFGAAGLTEQVGMAFASRCLSADAAGEDGDSQSGNTVDLAMLGGSMFVALFDEVSDMLTQVEIVLIDP